MDNTCVYSYGNFTIYRQDAGMGETEYRIAKGGEFYALTEHMHVAFEIVRAVQEMLER